MVGNNPGLRHSARIAELSLRSGRSRRRPALRDEQAFHRRMTAPDTRLPQTHACAQGGFSLLAELEGVAHADIIYPIENSPGGTNTIVIPSV
jgi:hypothetical protein